MFKQIKFIFFTFFTFYYLITLCYFIQPNDLLCQVLYFSLEV